MQFKVGDYIKVKKPFIFLGGGETIYVGKIIKILDEPLDAYNDKYFVDFNCVSCYLREDQMIYTTIDEIMVDNL